MVNRQVKRREKERGGFKYRSRDPKKVKERAEQTGGNFDSIFKGGIDTWRPKVGDNNIRILPPTWENHEHYGFEVWCHSYVGADSSTYLCPKKMKGKKCPICVAAQEAKEAGEDEEARQLKVAKKYLYWIVDRDGDSDTPQVYMVSWSMDRDIAALTYKKKTGRILELDHPDKGYDVMFRRVGQGLKTKYIGLQIDRDQSPIDESKKAQRGILEYIEENPLDSVLKFYDSKYLDEMLDGTSKKSNRDEDLDDDEDEDDDDDKKKKKKKKGRDRDDDDEDEDDDDKKSKSKKKKSKSRDDDEDEDDDSDDDDEDDADDDKPRGRRRGRDDDEDEDDDDDDRKKKKKKKRGDDDGDDEEDPADDDDDDGDDDEDEDDDDRKKKKKKKSKSDDDDEDDEDSDDDEDEDSDDDEDEDDDKPRKRKRR